MIRGTVGVMHCLVALSTLIGGAMWLVQMRLNLQWEVGLYGGVSLVTSAGLFAVAAALSLGALHLVGGVSWLRGRLWGGHILLALSVFYALVTPRPFRWLVMLGGVVILLDLWRRARPTPPPVAE